MRLAETRVEALRTTMTNGTDRGTVEDSDRAAQRLCASANGAQRVSRRPSVATLEASMLQALDCGDISGALRLTRQLVDIACFRKARYSSDDGVAAFQWLMAFLLDDELPQKETA